MLKGVDARLSPDLLRDLAATGHLESILVADGNFPVGRLKCPIHYFAGDTIAALDAVASVVPLETTDSSCVIARADVADAPLDTTQRAALETLQEHEPDLVGFRLPPIQEFAEAAFGVSVAVIASSARPSCFVLKRGVVL